MIDGRLFRGNRYICSLLLLKVNSLLKITTSFYISYFVSSLSSADIDSWIYRNNNHVKIKQPSYNYN